MTQSITYFTIPFNDVPQTPSYNVWFATWSTQRPTVDPQDKPPFVVGCTTGQVPQGGTSLGTSIKDPIPPPPPPLSSLNTSDYQSTVQTWLASGRGLTIG
ncbi:MAG TPA: hypothetical protein VIX73_13940 [Kofleriaceae bacterium]|jgi:hypothetical protein